MSLLCHELLRFALETPAAAQVDCVSNPSRPRPSTIIISDLNATIDSSQYRLVVKSKHVLLTCAKGYSGCRKFKFEVRSLFFFLKAALL